MTVPAAPRSTSPVAVLIGPPGSGCEAVGAALAARLRVSLRCVDRDVEARSGQPVAEVFVDLGETRFRELERECVLTALAEHPGVLALEGGAVLDGEVATALVGAPVAFVEVGIAHAARLLGFNDQRPAALGTPRSTWMHLMNGRRPRYAALARIVVTADDRDPADVAADVAAGLGLDPGERRQT
jgi:shikimate kinase